MRQIHLIMVVDMILIALTFAYSQAPQSTSQLAKRKSVEVTPQTIANLRAGRPYIIDLRNGKTYSVAADVASRVRIRTAKDEMAMTKLMTKLGVTSNRFLTGSKLLIGTLSDLRAGNFGRPLATRPSSTATAKSLTCDGIFCRCDPDIEGDCFGRKIACASPMICGVCDGPECTPEQRHRWTCWCVQI